MNELRDRLVSKIKTLNETIWENRVTGPVLDMWLANFAPDVDGQPSERLHALYLLGQFMYFGDAQIRELLKSLFRDLYYYPIVSRIRKQNSDTMDTQFITDEFRKELATTRFLGMGNPSESGSHLLYYFRQENALPKELFIHSHQVFSRYGAPPQARLRYEDVTHYVFIDDFCGSGQQASDYSTDLLMDVRRLKHGVHLAYYVLFGTKHGLKKVRESTEFDDVQCVFELDGAYKCFGEDSHYFLIQHNAISKTFAESLCRRYGSALWSEHPLGFDGCQLLVGFHHNTPDNTLPIIWQIGRAHV